MTTLFSTFDLKGHTVKNRIVFPPAVCFHYSGDDGMVTDRNYEHYRLRAEGGAGIIIQEATSVWKPQRLASFQLGIWSDDHIPGLCRIASVIKKSDALALVQIHQAGLITPPSVNPVPAGPSANEKYKNSRALLLDEIHIIRDAFISGAVRAKKAGFDGIELHGAHGYLLNEFACSYYNKREDQYGGDFAGRMRLATEIIRGIRQECGDQFIIDYRLGVNSPTLEDGIEIAKYLESIGVDILHVSHGGLLIHLPRPPKDFQFNWIVYSGTVIKTHVHIPVITVNEIKTSERASWLIENNKVDFVALARPQLADPAWANHVKNGEPVNICSSCKPRCKWYIDAETCPAVQRLKKA
ncbi:MAG: NADH:flavin oxidoreductase [Bacteroidota bacterium]|nr:NADH:flavin oxidoreductase [Bacteroidota bacterium]